VILYWESHVSDASLTQSPNQTRVTDSEPLSEWVNLGECEVWLTVTLTVTESVTDFDFEQLTEASLKLIIERGPTTTCIT